MNNVDQEVLKFHPNTVIAVRKEFGLDRPGFLKESIDLLEKWVAVQAHFVKKDFSREYLERILIASKGSTERAKLRLDKAFTIKGLIPEYFQITNARTDIGQFDDAITCAILPHLTEKHERVFILRNKDYSGPSSYIGIYKYFIKVLEYVYKNDYNAGIIVILDYMDMNIKNLIAKLHLVELRQIMSILMEGYGLRLRKLYILSSSKMIDAVATMLKQVLTTKLANRIEVFKDYKDLPDDITKKILPKDYDGHEKSMNDLNEILINALSSESFNNYLEDMQSAVTNEALRSSSVFNEAYLGAPGSFKRIVFD